MKRSKVELFYQIPEPCQSSASIFNDKKHRYNAVKKLRNPAILFSMKRYLKPLFSVKTAKKKTFLKTNKNKKMFLLLKYVYFFDLEIILCDREKVPIHVLIFQFEILLD